MKKTLLIFFMIILVAGCGVCGYFTYKYFDLKNQTDTTVKALELTDDIKTQYYLGESIDFKTAKLKVTYANNKTEDITLTSNMVEGFSTESAGNKTLKIKYEGKSYPVDYTVIGFRVGKYFQSKYMRYDATTNQLQYESTSSLSDTSSYYVFNLDGTGFDMYHNNLSDPFEKWGDFTWEYVSGMITITHSKGYVENFTVNGNEFHGITDSNKDCYYEEYYTFFE